MMVPGESGGLLARHSSTTFLMAACFVKMFLCVHKWIIKEPWLALVT